MGSLTIRGVDKRFRRQQALSGIELGLQDGDFCVLVGPPGSGKTTLLRMIAGLESVDAGLIEIDSEPVNDLPPGDRNVAMIFQTDALYPLMSVYRNIAFGLRARKMPRAEIDSRVKRFAEIAGIGNLLDLQASQLHDGERQIVAAGRAMVRDEPLCLFDDPLSTLDAKPRETVGAELKRLHAAYPSTKILATRDPTEAMTLGDRVVLMRGGRIEQDGTPHDLFEKPATLFVAGFFGSPAMNALPGTLTRAESGDVIKLGENGPNIPLPPGRVPKETFDGLPVVLGLRPEHMVRAVRASPADGSLRHDAEIELLRPIGSRTYATFKIGGVPVVAELQPHDASRPGDRIPIDINLKRIMIFDALTEQAL